MDLASPLRSLVPSLDSAVFEVLAGTESGLGVTRIAALAGRGSRTGHLRVLERLAEHGIVLAEPTNKGHTFRLNREHVLVPGLLLALSARRELLERLSGAVGMLSPPPTHGSVFGSFARGEGGELSDVDVLIVTPSDVDSDQGWADQMRVLEDQVMAWTGNRMESLVLSIDRLRDGVAAGEPIVDSLRDESISLTGPEFSALLEELTVVDGPVTR